MLECLWVLHQIFFSSLCVQPVRLLLEPPMHLADTYPKPQAFKCNWRPDFLRPVGSVALPSLGSWLAHQPVSCLEGLDFCVQQYHYTPITCRMMRPASIFVQIAQLRYANRCVVGEQSCLILLSNRQEARCSAHNQAQGAEALKRCCPGCQSSQPGFLAAACAKTRSQIFMLV